MAKTVDKRIIRTQKMIKNALAELIEEKGFEGITITDLTTKADINRGTFYLHYRDIYDLLEQSEDEIIQEIQELITEVIGIDLMSYVSKNKPLPFVVKIFEYYEANATFVRAILGPKGSPSSYKKLTTVMRDNLKMKMLTKANQEAMLVPEEFFLSYVVSAHIGVFLHWLNSEMKQSPYEMALILSKMTVLGPAYVAGLRGINYSEA